MIRIDLTNAEEDALINLLTAALRRRIDAERRLLVTPELCRKGT